MSTWKIDCANCVDWFSTLEDHSVSAVVTSPPYAQQRSGKQSSGALLYSGIPETEFPQWTVGWMEALKPKLVSDGSVLIVIRTHLRKGQISDYVYRTILAVRDAGWFECEKLIWLKRDAPPLGSIERPRRTYEEILWFSPSRKPYIDLKACGNAESCRLGGFAGSDRFGVKTVLNAGQNRGPLRRGTSRVSDVLDVPISKIDRGVKHPAMFPRLLAEQLILTYSPLGGLIADPFTGSGQTGLAALDTGRNFIGCDLDAEYVQLARERLAQLG